LLDVGPCSDCDWLRLVRVAVSRVVTNRWCSKHLAMRRPSSSPGRLGRMPR